jgi:hypothetical protein
MSLKDLEWAINNIDEYEKKTLEELEQAEIEEKEKIDKEFNEIMKRNTENM